MKPTCVHSYRTFVLRKYLGIPYKYPGTRGYPRVRVSGYQAIAIAC